MTLIRVLTTAVVKKLAFRWAVLYPLRVALNFIALRFVGTSILFSLEFVSLCKKNHPLAITPPKQIPNDPILSIIYALTSGLHHTRDWEPVTITFQALSSVEKAKPVQVRFTLCLRDQRSMWMHDNGCKVYMDSYMAWNESCFMVTWTISKNHLLEVGLIQNWETMTLRIYAHNRSFILFYHVWGPTWIEIHWNSMWLRARSHTTSHYTGGSVTTLHDLGGDLGRPLDTFFWALTISWSQLLASVWNGP
jgi:hypothetical protein